MTPDAPAPTRPHLPIVRIRHPCPGLNDFRAHHARAIALEGLFAATTRQRPVGTRVDLLVELRDGSRIRGEAITVDPSTADEGRPGTRYRFVQLTEGSLAYDEVAPHVFHPPEEELVAESFTPVDRLLIVHAALVDEAVAGPAPDVTIEIPLREDVLETRSAMDAERHAREAATRRRRARAALAAGAGVILVAVAAYLVAGSGASRALERELALADECFAEGRLTGGDAALDHLLAARGIRASDPRVGERLGMLADKLEQLAETALARGDVAEAAVHLTSASQAAPERKRIHDRLGEIARRRGARPRGAGTPPPSGDGTPSPSR